MRLDVRQRLHQVIAKLVDALRESAGELLIRRGQRQFRARMNHVRHRLGLRQVEAPIEERAPGELARLRQPRAVFQQRIQDELGREQSAVAGDLDHVLAREGSRRAHDGDQHLVDDLALTHDLPIVNRMRRRGGRLERGRALGSETFFSDGKRLRAGKPDDRQAAFSQRRGDGGNGVVEKHWKWEAGGVRGEARGRK